MAFGGKADLIHFYLVEKTPTPGLSWFKGPDDRMVGFMEVLGGMFVARVVDEGEPKNPRSGGILRSHQKCWEQEVGNFGDEHKA